MGVLSRAVAALAAVSVMYGLLAGSAGHAAVIVDNLLVRVYDTADVPPRVREEAFARAGEILSRVEIDVAWLECPAAPLPLTASACAAPPDPGELIVRLVRASPRVQRDHPHALGYSLVDTETRAGTLATVFVDRVDLLARHARFDRAAVLGRAMAHELAHLILGTNEHGGSGLMRERWTLEEIERNRPQDWQFTRAERDALHATIEANAATARRARAGAGSGGQNPHVLLNKTP